MSVTVTEYIKTHEQRMSVFLKVPSEVTADEARQLGLKSSEEYPPLPVLCFNLSSMYVSCSSDCFSLN